MDRVNRWKLADELTVYQIALLIAGYDPSEFERDQEPYWPDEVRQDISPFLNAVKNAARSGKIETTIVRYEGYGNGDDINWNDSTVNVDSLCEWMRRRNFQDGFFLEQHAAVDKVSDKSGQFYAPKLAAALRAWNEVTADPDALNGKTPKRALEVWLRKHSSIYGLTNKDGNPNELGIEEICKVANWKPAGGASPTAATMEPTSRELPETGRKVKPRPPTPPKRKPATGGRSLDLEDDIPF